MCDQQRLRPACAYAQSDQSLYYSLEYSMIIKLLTEQHLEFLHVSLTGDWIGSSESTLVKKPHFWKLLNYKNIFSEKRYLNFISYKENEMKQYSETGFD